ncbi:helix-turn-helix domain-containing protein [Corallococcus carmarthensis]|uniref:Helix-turn-helix domain-containing protein n=2 Tax=Corallococcus carmarthensis TaxID=2316728 RepID=A0A3A8KD04_9BACT|nr:helix-turn-helix domain-containing protein [Corallococcus carmarthensis]
MARSAEAGWVERDRVEMVQLAAEGWSAPRIGAHLGWSAATVHRVLRAALQPRTQRHQVRLRRPQGPRVAGAQLQHPG